MPRLTFTGVFKTIGAAPEGQPLPSTSTGAQLTVKSTLQTRFRRLNFLFERVQFTIFPSRRCSKNAGRLSRDTFIAGYQRRAPLLKEARVESGIAEARGVRACVIKAKERKRGKKKKRSETERTAPSSPVGHPLLIGRK